MYDLEQLPRQNLQSSPVSLLEHFLSMACHSFSFFGWKFHHMFSLAYFLAARRASLRLGYLSMPLWTIINVPILFRSGPPLVSDQPPVFFQFFITGLPTTIHQSILHIPYISNIFIVL